MMTNLTGKRHNKNWKEARSYFGVENNPEMVLHHKDPTLKDRDPKRYLEWRVDDLEVMTVGDHTRLHATGRVLSPETKRLISENHVGFKGKQHSEETKAKISEALKGVPKSEEAVKNMNANRAHLSGKDNVNSKPIICVETGTLYYGAAEASRLLGIARTGIIRCCNGVKYYKTAGGYHWRWADV